MQATKENIAPPVKKTPKAPLPARTPSGRQRQPTEKISHRRMSFFLLSAYETKAKTSDAITGAEELEKAKRHDATMAKKAKQAKARNGGEDTSDEEDGDGEESSVVRLPSDVCLIPTNSFPVYHHYCSFQDYDHKTKSIGST